MRTVLFALGSAAAGCGSAADEKPDFALTAEEYAGGWSADKKAFAKKYQGKVVELTATVWNMRLDRGDILLNGKKGAKELVANIFSATPAELEGPLRALSRGQAVTVRGKQPAGDYPALVGAEFVKVGPSTAVPATVAGLAAEFKQDAAAADRKYEKGSVVLRVKVAEAKVAGDEVKLTVADAAGKADVKVVASANLLLGMHDVKMAKEFRKLKAGDVVVLMGEADEHGEPFRLSGVFLLAEPPAGVELPGER